MSPLEFRVQREEFTDESTVGRLFYRLAPTDPWNWLCYTLEDVVHEIPGQPVASWKIPGETAIPYGTYNVIVNRSERFSAKACHDVILPLLLDVPGFAGVRMHGGNNAGDTEGCLLVAHGHPCHDFIQSSAVADLLAILGTQNNEATITICTKDSP